MRRPMSASGRPTREAAPTRPSWRSIERGGASPPEREGARSKDAVERPVTSHEVGSAFWTDPGGAGQFIGRIAAKRDEVGYLFRVDAVSLPDLFGADARDFAGPHGIEDRRARRGQLKRVPISAGDKDSPARALLGGSRGGKKSSASNPGALALANPHAATSSGSAFNCSISSSSNSRPL